MSGGRGEGEEEEEAGFTVGQFPKFNDINTTKIYNAILLHLLDSLIRAFKRFRHFLELEPSRETHHRKVYRKNIEKE